MYGQGEISGQKVMLIKPQTYMNSSGEAIRELRNYYNFDMDKLIVIVDDIDINFGTIRIKAKGSSGSHNGMKSIIYNLVDDSFPRIKIAVGKKPEYMDFANFVLSGFTEKEVEIIRDEIALASDAVEMILDSGVEKAMNKFNSIKLIDE